MAKAPTPTEKLVLSRVPLPKKEEDAVRRGLDEGVHAVDFVARVKGNMVVNPPGDRAAWLNVGPLRAIIAHLFAKPCKPGSLMKRFSEDPDGFMSIEIPDEVTELFEAMAAKMPRQKMAGEIAMTGVQFEVLEAEDIQALARTISAPAPRLRAVGAGPRVRINEKD